MSIRVFRGFLRVNPDGSIDASQIHSRECYSAFLEAKCVPDSEEEAKKFYRVLTTHLSGVDGRRPFEKMEEDAILIVLRKTGHWPCFPNHMRLGNGFRGKGFHEKQLGEPKKKRVRVAPVEEPVPAPVAPVTHALLDDANLAQTVAKHITEFSSSFSNFGIDVWKSIFGLIRFILLARTQATEKPVSTEQIVKLMNQQPRDENVSVTIMNLLSKNFGERIVAQDELSIACFGNVMAPPAEDDGALPSQHTRVAMQKEDLYEVVYAMSRCFCSPGTIHTLYEQKMKGVDNVVRLYTLTYQVDPESYLLVIRARKL